MTLWQMPHSAAPATLHTNSSGSLPSGAGDRCGGAGGLVTRAYTAMVTVSSWMKPREGSASSVRAMK